MMMSRVLGMDKGEDFTVRTKVQKYSYKYCVVFDTISGYPRTTGDFVDSPSVKVTMGDGSRSFETMWKLRLYPHGPIGSPGNTSCYLVREPVTAGTRGDVAASSSSSSSSSGGGARSPEPDVRASFTFSVLHPNDKSVAFKKYCSVKTFNPSGGTGTGHGHGNGHEFGNDGQNEVRREWGFSGFIPSGTFNNHYSSGYLKNDQLIVEVDLHLYGDFERSEPKVLQRVCDDERRGSSMEQPHSRTYCSCRLCMGMNRFRTERDDWRHRYSKKRSSSYDCDTRGGKFMRLTGRDEERGAGKSSLSEQVEFLLKDNDTVPYQPPVQSAGSTAAVRQSSAAASALSVGSDEDGDGGGDGLDTDVVIVAGDDRQRIRAHRWILSLRSAVFRTMLSSAMEESRSRRIVIPDFDADVVRVFVK